MNQSTIQIFRGAILRPALTEESGFEFILDGLIVVQDGKIVCATSLDDVAAHFIEQYASIPELSLRKDGLYFEGDPILSTPYVILPGAVNTHCHMFQPPGVAGRLIEESPVGKKKTGWLPTTLEFEAMVKKSPSKAKSLARRKFEQYLTNGITGSLEYTTSSEPAARMALDIAEEMGLGNRVKVGYVAMDGGIRGTFGDELGDVLEESLEEALRATEELLETYRDRVVVIDRFPLTVSSPLRQQLAILARKYGVLYETHADETVVEQGIHREIYGGRSIVQTLADDGVFEPRSKVGLAHAIHTAPEDMKTVKQAIEAGCDVYIRACPNSNAQLKSHETPDGFVPFPLREWEAVGAKITLGLDKGAGRGWNLFAEMLYERGRPHASTPDPSSLDLLRYGIINGMESLSLNLDESLCEGSPANFIVVRPDLIADLPNNAEDLAACVIEGAQDASRIQCVYVEGKILKN